MHVCRQTAAQCAARLLHLQEATAFTKWLKLARREAQLRQAAKETTQLCRHRLQLQCWGTWWAAYLTRQQLRAAVQRLSRGSAHRALLQWKVTAVSKRPCPGTPLDAPSLFLSSIHLSATSILCNSYLRCTSLSQNAERRLFCDDCILGHVSGQELLLACYQHQA